jgi:uncharacterized RDD family membrane protein YckC
MTATAERYIASVLEHLPRDRRMREQIALELRSHVTERLAQGEQEADVLRRLGDPRDLAESYLSAVPLVAGSFVARAVAKVFDVALAALTGVAVTGIGLLAARLWDVPQAMPFAALAGVIGGSLAFLVYTIATEATVGATLGKRAMGLQVVRESGGPITIGQALVRQLPWLLQVFWIDVLFVPFTDRRQRAFELLSKTRVVVRTDGPGD